VQVQAGDKLIFDAKGYAQDFSLNYTNNGTWYLLTGTSQNPWLTLGTDWQHIELTFPVSGVADYFNFNVYAPGQEVSLDNLTIGTPVSSNLTPAAMPVFSPENPSIFGPTQVTIICSTPNAAIHYTTDGSEPTATSATYTGSVTVDNDVTLKAMALASGYSASPVKSVTYTVVPPIPGDASKDGKVNVVDLGILATNYGIGGVANWAMGDFNNDGNVTVVDLGILATHYGEGGASENNFAADTKALGLDVPESQTKDDSEVSTGIPCPAAGLPLIAGLLLAVLGLSAHKLEN